MTNYSSPSLNVYIVQHKESYPELGSLTEALRHKIPEIIITRADYATLERLVRTIVPEDNNVLILLTKDIDMDLRLHNELAKISSKNIRVILYPRSLVDTNSYLIAKNQDEIVKAVVILYNVLIGKHTVRTNGAKVSEITSYRTNLPNE